MLSGQIGGLIVRRKPLVRLASARFARSLTAGMNHIARDTHALPCLTWWCQGQAICCHVKQQYFSIVTECKQTDRRWIEWATMGLEIVV